MNSQLTIEQAPDHSLWKDPILWLALLLSLLIGAIYNALPVSFPVFKRVFGITLEEMGKTQFLFFVSALAAGLGGGWFVGQLGLRRALVVALTFLSGILVLIGSATGFAVVLVGAFCFGLAVASLTIMTLALIGERFVGRLQSVYFLSGICDALGSTIGPAVLGGWFSYADAARLNWRTGYYVAATIPLILAFFSLRSLPSFVAKNVGSDSKFTSFSLMTSILSKPTIYAISLLGLLHGLAQGGAVSFYGQLFQKTFQINAAQAAYLLSARSAGNFVGRSVLAWLTVRWRISEMTIIATCAFAAALAFAATIVSASYYSGLLLFGLAGVFVSATGPSLNSMVGSRFASRTAMAFALFAGINCVGAAGGAYIIGVVGNWLGVENGIWFVPFFSLSLAVVTFAWFLRNRLKDSSRSALPVNQPAAE
jgi:fucose permease